MTAMENRDMRWERGFFNYKKAFNKLDSGVNTIKEKYADKDVQIADDFLGYMLKDALIHVFGYTHELAWKVMKDYLAEVGNLHTIGSRDASREAFSAGLITDGELWMEMLKSRNMTSHTYNEETADDIYSRIMKNYHEAFLQFKNQMEGKLKK